MYTLYSNDRAPTTNLLPHNEDTECIYTHTTITQYNSALHNATLYTDFLLQDPKIGSENAVWPPVDGRKDARNMLRNYWLPIKPLIVASSWSHLYLLIKDARSFEYKVCLVLNYQ